MPKLVWFGASSKEAIAKFEQQEDREIDSIEFGEVAEKKALVGFTVNSEVVACLWGTEDEIGECDGRTAKPYRKRGLGKALLRAYIERYRGRVRRFQADPINQRSERLLARVGFTPQENGQWVLAGDLD